MRCQHCGAEIPADTTLCPVCASEVANETKRSVTRLIFGGAALLLVCLCAVCAHFLNENSKLHEALAASSITLAETDEDTAAAIEATLPCSTDCYAVTNDENMPLGTRSTITMTEDALKAMGSDDFAALWDTAVSTDDLYFTVLLENGTGLVFTRGNTTTAAYGTLDANGYIAAVLGIVVRQENGTFVYSPSLQTETVTTSQISIGNSIIESADTPEDNATAQSATETADQNIPGTVYVTVSGSKYHRADCSFLRSSKIVMSLDEAKEKGYTACSRCNP